MSTGRGRKALRGALGEETPSEVTDSFRSTTSNDNQSQSPDKVSSPRKAAGKENATPKGRPPVTKKKPGPKSKQKAPAASTSKAASSRRKSSSEESEIEESSQNTIKANKAAAVQKKNTRAPPHVESESESEETPPKDRSGRSRNRQPRETSAPTPRPVGRPPKTQAAPVARNIAQPARTQTAAAKRIEKPVGAQKRKQNVPVGRDILRLQASIENQIPRAPFSRLVREVMQKTELQNSQMRVTPEALEALRESTEAFLTQVFSDSYLITLNRKQVTLAPKDIQLLMFLRGPSGAHQASTR